MSTRLIRKSNLIYGVGVNDSNYQIKLCPYYAVWKIMLKRCYTSSFHKSRPSYVGCSVGSEWLLFSSFKSWMEIQDWEGKHLDKDVICPGNKVYSSETCVFISPELNNLLTNHSAKRGKYPQGVSFAIGKFNACLSISGKNKHIKRCDSAEEASLAYKEAKRLHILKVACCEPDIRVKQGLYRHSELLR